MLAKYYRLRGVNNTDQTMTYANGARIAIRLTPWKIASGGPEYRTVITEDLGFTTGTITDGSEVEGTVRDNTSNLDIGCKGYIEVTHDVAAANGTFDLYMEESDDNSNWPSDQLAFDVTKHCILLTRLSVVNGSADDDSAKNFDI
jgi:hypothetical protein